MDPVRCRAEHAYPGRPVEVCIEEQWLTVTKVIDLVHVTNGKRFKVICSGEIYIGLEYNQALDEWKVTPGVPGKLHN